jgi:hypothetical protein
LEREVERLLRGALRAAALVSQTLLKLRTEGELA